MFGDLKLFTDCGCEALHTARLATRFVAKLDAACQQRKLGHYPLPARTADSSSTNAVHFPSARTTKRIPSSRCASAIQIVRPLESIADTQPQLHNALLRKADDRTVHFGIKSRSGQRRALGTQLRARFASRTQMNVRRPLIVKELL